MDTMENVRSDIVHSKWAISMIFKCEIEIDKGTHKKIEEGLEEMVRLEFRKWDTFKLKYGLLNDKAYFELMEDIKWRKRGMEVVVIKDGKEVAAAFGTMYYGAFTSRFYKIVTEEWEMNINTQVFILAVFSDLNGDMNKWPLDRRDNIRKVVEEFYSIFDQVKILAKGLEEIPEEIIAENEALIEKSLNADLMTVMTIGCLLSMHEEEAKMYFPVNKIISKSQKMTNIKVKFDQRHADLVGMHYIVTNAGAMIGIFGGRIYGGIPEEAWKIIHEFMGIKDVQKWTLISLSGESEDFQH
jgi:hypothetical protein